MYKYINLHSQNFADAFKEYIFTLFVTMYKIYSNICQKDWV